MAQRLDALYKQVDGDSLGKAQTTMYTVVQAAALMRACEAVLRETAAFDDGDSVYWWGDPQDSVMKRIRKLLGD